MTVNVIPASAPSLSGPAWSTGIVTLNWTAVAGATRYQLNQNLGGTVTVPFNANGTSWTSGSLANGNYAYQVFACNAGGCGPGSNVPTVFVSNQPPTAPTVLSAPSPATPTEQFEVTTLGILRECRELSAERPLAGARGWPQRVDICHPPRACLNPATA